MNIDLTTFYIIRHGESESNAQSISEESTENNLSKELGSNLTAKGREQVKKLAVKLAMKDFASILSSDLTRAVETARILASEKNLIIESTDKLRERNYGPRTREEQYKIKQQINQQLYKEQSLSETEKMKLKIVEGVETGEEVVKRVLGVLTEYGEKHPGKQIILTTHGEVVRLLLFHFKEANHHELPSGHIDNTGYIVLQFDGGNFTLIETQGVNKNYE